MIRNLKQIQNRQGTMAGGMKIKELTRKRSRVEMKCKKSNDMRVKIIWEKCQLGKVGRDREWKKL